MAVMNWKRGRWRLPAPSARQRPVSQHPSFPDSYSNTRRMRVWVLDLSIHRRSTALAASSKAIQVFDSASLATTFCRVSVKTENDFTISRLENQSGCTFHDSTLDKTKNWITCSFNGYDLTIIKNEDDNIYN